jgi:hypothetical protein
VNNYFNDDTALQKSVWVFLFRAAPAFFCWLSQIPARGERTQDFTRSTSAKILFLSPGTEKWHLDTQHYRFGERIEA